MPVNPLYARKAAYFFITLICGALGAILVYTAYQKLGPARMTVENVPFGLPAGSSILVGDAPDEMKGLARMPAATQQELQRASDLALNGFDKEAAEVYQALAMQYPAVFRAQWGAVNVLLGMDSLSSVQQTRLEAMVQSLKSLYPGSGVSLYLDARVAERSGSSSTATELARLSTEKAPSLFETHLFYARLLYEANRYSQGTLEARTAVSLSHGDLAAPYALLASLYHNQGLLDSCGLVVEYALSKFPADENLLRLQGYLMEYKGHFEDAEKVYRRILALHPDSRAANQALLTLGEKSPPGDGNSETQLTPRDRAQVACDILEPLVAQYPENLPLREALGRAYLKGREFGEAKDQFQEIQSRDPDYPDIGLRLQEASATEKGPMENELLAENLNRVADSMRTIMPSKTHDFETMLGHYLVRYGASPKEFFAKYSVTRFRQLAPTVWQESFYEAPYYHQYTILFDSTYHFYGVHVLVRDSNLVANTASRVPEVYTHLVEVNTRISGVGNGTGETDCNGTVMEGVVWETRDNFEILAHLVGKPAEVRMIRLDRSIVPDGMRLCDYLSYLNHY